VSEPKQRARVWFVDVVRLIASFQMINGHTLDVLMVDELRQGTFFHHYTWARGLVSVAFLTVAGLAFHLATLARFDAHKGSKDEVRKRLRRAGILLLLGYFLRFPGAAFGDDPTAAAEAWNLFLQCGVLQCIGVALFVLEVSTILLPKPRHVVYVAATCALLFIGGAPLLHFAPLDGAWRPFTSYLTHAGGSLFPLFPWAGYMFAGCVLGWATLPQGGRTPTRVAVPRLVGALTVTVLIWQGLSALGPLVPEGVHQATKPAFALEKLSAVVAIVLVLAVVCAPIKTLPKLLRILSKETLFVYVFHLWVLFNGVFAIHQTWGRTQPLAVSLCASAAMMALTVGATLVWHHRKAIVEDLRRRAVPTPSR